jgi:glycosyltransferase involved in cell wall biosynthesis
MSAMRPSRSPSEAGRCGSFTHEPALSVIIPVYNEEESLPHLMESLDRVLKEIGKTFEVLFVDDGSSDRSLGVIKGLREKRPHVRIVRHLKNCGLSAAMATGFRYARGGILATMDADLQNDPADLPELLLRLDVADAVVGWRHERRDNTVKKISSRVANWIRNRVTREDIHDTGCTLKVFRREFIEHLTMYQGMHRFLPTLLKMEGARVLQVKVRHHSRRHGVSKFGLTNRLLGPLQDLLAVRWMQKRRITTESEEVT